MEVVSGTEGRAKTGVTTAGETGELGGLTKVIGASVDPHPRGSLFDDDILDHGDMVPSFLDAQGGDSKGEENGSSDFTASQQVMMLGLHPSRMESLADVPCRLALAAYNHSRKHRA